MSPIQFYKCLADDTRLKTLLLITLKQELCVCELQEALAVSQPKISRHLAELRKCELLIDERRGKWVYYQLNPELPAWAVTVLQETAANNSEYLHPHLQQLSQGCANC
ncbi:metalloregulator ArsR/SmtB family transcription factor [Spongiibacter sp. KMU-158]|uniref:Metalloregulator ArsR/SmtB family transcription factor n=1 Tax=Spongiibacter pelagi TaxID=2760804 RepID=A0A927C4F1_9GAMM|nr:metalloregulator ArsR/SmtB family transcription factor [Spongiibacter pelagi]MBD2859822.1 metalloregulator ArsR/SmtB family transcription factor [Spongiibacter pelagi]